MKQDKGNAQSKRLMPKPQVERFCRSPILKTPKKPLPDHPNQRQAGLRELLIRRRERIKKAERMHSCYCL
jgi:hypothetical protein